MAPMSPNGRSIGAIGVIGGLVVPWPDSSTDVTDAPDDAHL
jgi:hypothetical protein